MLSSRQVLRFPRRPFGASLRKCLATEAAEGGPAMALTFGSPRESVNKQLEQAQQELSSASSEVDKAKAAIAVECAEALQKSLH
ncbi:hypothetical protein QZH41_010601 [Actinostola sp. cb2023]|nr:hypothetical protein QZH41_010601 [Actinostola sp. cb2023]